MVNQKLRLSSSGGCVGQSVKTAQSNFVDHETFKSLEEIEAQTIGDLLPNDDDLFSGALHGVGYVAPTNRTDVEDDLFYSVGGLELESDDNFGPKKVSEIVDGEFNGQHGRFGNFPSSEFSCGERPSRTLFVKNINGIEDLELRLLFEQFGEIQALFTACRHRGFILVSFYDVRAAQNAIRVLQTNSIRNQKLDMHFCVPMDNPSEKDINLGALVVANIDSSVSNDDLLHIFSVYGQIKEICDIPHKMHQKFVEYYDIRAAEAAFSALNMLDIAGKRIKIEPCCPGDAIVGSSRQQLDFGLEENQLNGSRGESFGVHNRAMHGMLSAFDMPHSVSSPARVAMMGSRFNQSDDYDLSYSLGQRNIGFQSMSNFADFQDGMMNGLSFNSPSTLSAMAMNISSSLANGLDSRIIGRVGNNNHSFEAKEAAYGGLGNGSSFPHGHDSVWNHSNSYHPPHPGSSVWLPFMNSIPPQTSQMHGLTRAPARMPNPLLSLHQQVGSAPVVDPALFEGSHSYMRDVAAFHPASLGSIGYSSFSPVHSSNNIFPHSAGNRIDPSFISAHVGIHSPQQRGNVFRSMSASNDLPNDRIRSRRTDSSANQADNRKQYELDIERIIRGEDSRTTLMIKNIPNKYTSKMLLATIDEQHKGTYDFIYLPIDFKNKCNVGYAFINMTDPKHIIPFYQAFNGKKWEKFNSEKVASLAYARIQGKSALVAHFQNSSLMNEDKRCRPILFHSDGPNAGDQEPFPVGLNIRSRRSRTNPENHQGSPSGSSSEEESANLPGSPTLGSDKDSGDRANFTKGF